MLKPHPAVIASALLATTSATLASTEAVSIPSFFTQQTNITDALPGVRPLKINDALRRQLKTLSAEGETVRITSIPLPDGTKVDADLRAIDPFPDGFKLEMAPGLGSKKASHFVDPDNADMLFLKGNLTGDSSSLVFLATYEDRIHGMIEQDGRTLIIASDPTDQGRPTTIFNPIELPEGVLDEATWECETHQADIGPIMPNLPDGGVAGQTGTCRVVKLAFELDWELVAGPLESNAFAVLFYLGTVLSISDEIYRRDSGVGLVFSYGRAWYESADPWDELGTYSQLSQFRDYWNTNMTSTDRDVAILLSGRNLGGGRAWDIGTLCTTEDSYNVCGSMTGGFPYPAQSNHDDNWDLFVFMHELGHNLGASHTHAYTPTLDDCMTFNGCTTAPNGTLMSYCHMCPGGYSNIMLEFHPNIAGIINANVMSANCLEEIEASIIANDDSVITFMNTAKWIEILDNDEATCAQPHVYAYSSVSVQGGIVQILPNAGPLNQDAIRYIPPVGFTGTDSFVYQASDDLGNLDLATVNIEVIGQPSINSEYLVFDQFDNSVRRIDADTFESLGYFLPAYNTLLSRPRSIAVLPNGDVIIGDDGLNKVLRFDGNTGGYLGVFFQDPQLEGCEAIVVIQDKVLMLDFFNAKVFKTNLQGSTNALIYQGSGIANDMAISPTSQLWITGNINGAEAIVIDPFTGSLFNTITDIQDLENPGAVTFGEGLVQIADSVNGSVVRIAPNGNGSTIQWVLTASEALEIGLTSAREFAEGPDYGTSTGRVCLAGHSGGFEFEEPGTFTGVKALGNSAILDAPWAITYRQGLYAAADITQDGEVNGADLGLLLAQFGGPGSADFDGNDLVDGADLGLMLAQWTE